MKAHTQTHPQSSTPSTPQMQPPNETHKDRGTAENVDTAEVAQFDRLAERWWSPEGEFKPLHDINPLRANWIHEHCPVVNLKGLDVGCGGGILCEALVQRGATMTGIDMSERAINVARQHSQDSRWPATYELTTAESHAKTHAGYYDFVTCLEMLEHVPDPASTVRACFELVRPGGQVFFSTINRNPKAFMFAIIGAEHILKLLPKGTHQYRNFIRPSELAQWVRQAGGEHHDLIGMTYNPVLKRYALKKDVSVNYLMQTSRPLPASVNG